MDNTIITIGRQYGSGGREIGEKLAEQLGYTYYDTLILEKASKESGITQSVMKRYDEQLADKWLDPMVTRFMTKDNLPLSVRIALAQFEIIRQIGEKGAAVIVGRCADHVLRNRENVLTVFVHADQEHRLRRVVGRNNISVNEAETRIRNTDKHRAAYYNYYAEKKWGAATTYQLCLDIGALGIDGVVNLLQYCVAEVLKSAGLSENVRPFSI